MIRYPRQTRLHVIQARTSLPPLAPTRATPANMDEPLPAAILPAPCPELPPLDVATEAAPLPPVRNDPALLYRLTVVPAENPVRFVTDYEIGDGGPVG